MAQKKVAVLGDTSASAGAALFTGASSGSWSAGPISETSHSMLTVGGARVIHRAMCTFAFAGDVSGVSTVTLSAADTIVQGSSNKVLVDGDSEDDDFGNMLSVSASGVLLSKKG